MHHKTYEPTGVSVRSGGALGRLLGFRGIRRVRAPAAIYGTIVAAGVAVLLNSRPWEGMMIMLPAGAMLYYAWRITGNPLRLPCALFLGFVQRRPGACFLAIALAAFLIDLAVDFGRVIGAVAALKMLTLRLSAIRFGRRRLGLALCEHPAAVWRNRFASSIEFQAGLGSFSEDLVERLGALGWPVVTASQYTGRMARVADILHTAWTKRKEYEVAQIDLFSGPAFFWAPALDWLLGRLQKPYILTLHDGKLPDFSSRWPRLTGWPLRRAARVIAPSGYLADALHGFQHDIEILPNAISLESYPFRWRTSARTRLVWLRAFHGRISKNAVAATIDSGDIFLNTSKIDNHLVTLLEARACWACVVTTQSGGVPYIVQDEVNCLSAEAGDATGFARAISELLTRRNWPHAFHAKPARASKLAIGRPSSRAGASCSAARQKHPATQRRGYTYEVTDCHSGV